MRESQTFVIERNVEWRGRIATEPWEAGWASEAVFFVRVLDGGLPAAETSLQVQLSPDGIRWSDEGTVLDLPTGPGQVFCRVNHFGNWLRLAGAIPEGSRLRVIVYLVLKE